MSQTQRKLVAATSLPSGESHQIAASGSARNSEPVQVWLTEPDDPGHIAEEYVTFLSYDERSRCERLRLEAKRRQFVIGRGFLRSVLAAQTGIRPQEVLFRYGRNGKPELGAEHGPHLHFNLSHTHGLIAVAVSRFRRIGIDAEHVTSIRAPDHLAQLSLSTAELHEYTALPNHSRTTRLLEAWTAKEAYLKALGRGLNWSLPDLLVCRSQDGTATIRRSCGQPVVAGIACWVASGPQHLVAVSTPSGAGLQVVLHWFRRSEEPTPVADCPNGN